MKTFYTVRDIEDMHATGVVEIEIHDDVVLTDVAREKAIALGMHLKTAAQDTMPRTGGGASAQSAAAPPKTPPVAPGATAQAPASPAAPQAGNSAVARTTLIRQVKSAVVARLGTDKYNDLLDRIIPQVIDRIK
jgi:hypothetical protein